MIHSLKNIKSLFITLLILLISCEQEIQWNFENEQEFLVVDAIIGGRAEVKRMYSEESLDKTEV